MDLSAQLSAALAGLSEALDQPGGDLERQLDSLCAALTHAVPSFIGMTVTLAVDRHEISFTVGTRPSTPRIATSLLIPLNALSATSSASTILFYAAVPGAFVDLAADLSHATRTGLDSFILDGHRSDTFDGLGMTGLEGQSSINQAIGVLIDRGYTPEAALDELHRRAQLDSGKLEHAAEQVLASITDIRPQHD